MRFNSDEQTREINLYFRDFVLDSCKESRRDLEALRSTIEEIRVSSDARFDRNWSFLWTVVCLIEMRLSVRGFTSDRNYFRFDFEDGGRVQDKGRDKLEAAYSCCHKALEKYWKEKSAPTFSRGCEPFGQDDFDVENFSPEFRASHDAMMSESMAREKAKNPDYPYVYDPKTGGIWHRDDVPK